jgi:hypothetical protein
MRQNSRFPPMFCVIALGAALLAPSAWAFRCNSYVIDAGMPKFEVLRKCGQPSSKEQRIDRRLVRVRLPAPPGPNVPLGGRVEVERELQVQAEEWVYNFGPNQFMQLLLFEDGRLLSVKDIGYGS